MIPPLRCKAIRTESGKWVIRITEFSFYVLHDLPQLCSEIDDRQRMNAEKCLGTNCHIVDVAVVDARLWDAFQSFYEGFRYSCNNDESGAQGRDQMHRALEEIDKLRKGE
jgi:hypothetical protein